MSIDFSNPQTPAQAELYADEKFRFTAQAVEHLARSRDRQYRIYRAYGQLHGRPAELDYYGSHLAFVNPDGSLA